MGTVLVGGLSSRMGQDKAGVVVGGRRMVDWVTEAMEATFDEVVIIGRSDAVEGLRVIEDAGEAHRGPLSGLVTALTVLEGPLVLVAIDQPLVRTETLERLANHAASGRTAVCMDEVPQVTCAAYAPDVLDIARSHLESGGSIRTVLAQHPHLQIEPDVWRSWGEDGRSWYSMDTQDDIVNAEQRFRMNLLG